MKNTNNDLRNILFGQLQAITDPEEGTNMEQALATAKAVADIGKVIIQSAKLEMDYLLKKEKMDIDGTSQFLEQKPFKLQSKND